MIIATANTCTYCHVRKDDLAVPWHVIPQKPQLRTEQTMLQCFETFLETGSSMESKGVVGTPLLLLDPMSMMFPYLHVFIDCLAKKSGTL